jgi:predicted metal-dependent phosphoesterase TrpH
LIDLHTHTTASDGRCSPEELVARAARAGITVLAVTDHDTLEGCAPAAAACAAAGIEFVIGIEMTAVGQGADMADIHVLGYFVDPASFPLNAFLLEQRQRRIDRVREMIARLATFGIELDAEAIVKPAVEIRGKSAGRPWIARALVDGGHVADTNEAFDRWLGRGKPAFVPRLGASPEEVVARIHEANGIASLAHPGLVHHDESIPGLVRSGLDALEAYHSEHDHDATFRYVSMADALGIAVSGGSDYHADESHGALAIGTVSLPREAFERLVQRKRTARA